MRRILTLLLIPALILTQPVIGQIIGLDTPQTHQFQPVSPTKSPSFRQSINPILSNGPAQKYSMGATSDDIMRQLLQQQQLQMGAPTPGIQSLRAAQREKEYNQVLVEIQQDEQSSYANMQSRKRTNANVIDAATAKAVSLGPCSNLKLYLSANNPPLLPPSLSQKMLLASPGFREPSTTAFYMNQ